MRREIRNNVPKKIYLVYTFCGKALFAHLITELYMYDKIEHDCTTPKKLLLIKTVYYCPSENMKVWIYLELID